MPEMEFAPTPDVQLFPDDDPLRIVVKGKPKAKAGTPAAGGKFLCKDRWNPTIEDDQHDLRSRPISTLFEIITSQVVPDQADACEAALVLAWETQRIDIDSVLGMIKWLAEQRSEAEKRAVEGETDRPTRARARSSA